MIIPENPDTAGKTLSFRNKQFIKRRKAEKR